MTYEVRHDRTNPEDWLVGAVDYDSEGECYWVIFSGWYAHECAQEYADWEEQSGARRARLFIRNICGDFINARLTPRVVWGGVPIAIANL